jgi:Domain of unknown function (DUF4037)
MWTSASTTTRRDRSRSRLSGPWSPSSTTGTPPSWNHIYAGEVHHGLALHDPDGVLAERKARTSPYPQALGRAIVRRYLWEAGFAVQTATGAARRGDLAYVSGCLFRAVACLVQVLFAVNGRWFVNEKGSVAEAAEPPCTPPGFAAAVAAMGTLTARVRELV